MNLEITTRNYDPTKRVQSHAEDRISRFDKYLRDLNQIRLTFAEEKLDKVCEIHLRAYGKDFHARAQSEDMLQSVDRVCASMEKQLRRHKSRLTDQRKGSDKSPLSSAATMEQISQVDDEELGTDAELEEFDDTEEF